MKQAIYQALIKNYNRLLSGILFLLGFTLAGCDKEQADMYGTPYADHTIKGKVINQSAKGIADIPVEVIRIFDAPDTTRLVTNESGEFTYNKPTLMETDEYKLIFNSPPGQMDLRFKADSLIVNFKDAEYRKGDKSWYKGEATKEISIQLKDQKDE